MSGLCSNCTQNEPSQKSNRVSPLPNKNVEQAARLSVERSSTHFVIHAVPKTSPCLSRYSASGHSLRPRKRFRHSIVTDQKTTISALENASEKFVDPLFRGVEIFSVN